MSVVRGVSLTESHTSKQNLNKNFNKSFRKPFSLGVRKLETATINYPQIMNQEPVSPNGQTANNFVAVAPCGGLIGRNECKKGTNDRVILKTFIDFLSVRLQKKNEQSE